MDIASIGIDLGKTTFLLVGLNHQGKVVVRKKLLTPTTARLHGKPAAVVQLDLQALHRLQDPVGFAGFLLFICWFIPLFEERDVEPPA